MVEILELLVTNGADINKQDDRGYSALHICAWENYADCIPFLLSHGANVNAVTKSGQTPLALAEANENTESADLLHK